MSSSASEICLVAIFHEDTLAVTMLSGGSDLRERLWVADVEMGATWPSMLLGTRLSWCYFAAIVLIDEGVRNGQSIRGGNRCFPGERVSLRSMRLRARGARRTFDFLRRRRLRL